MSISASEKEDWAGSEPDQLDSSEPSDLQEELKRIVLSKAVQELELTWSPPEEPVRSKLDSWYFRSTRKADSRSNFSVLRMDRSAEAGKKQRWWSVFLY